MKLFGWHVEDSYPLWPSNGAFLGIKFKPISDFVGGKSCCLFCFVLFCTQCGALAVASNNCANIFTHLQWSAIGIRMLHSIMTIFCAVSWLIVPCMQSPSKQVSALHYCYVSASTSMLMKGLLMDDPMHAFAMRTAVYSVATMTVQVGLFRQCSISYTLLLWVGFFVRIVQQCMVEGSVLQDAGTERNYKALYAVAITYLCMAGASLWFKWSRYQRTQQTSELHGVVVGCPQDSALFDEVGQS